MSWREEIKKNNPTDVTDLKYKKEWVALIYIKISNLEHYCQYNSNASTAVMLKTFHEGISSILRKHRIELVDIREGMIYGACQLPTKNSERGEDIINASLDINGYLQVHWKFTNFRIALILREELMLVVDDNGRKKVVFANGIIEEAEYIIGEGTSNNAIYFSPRFFENNKEILIDKESGKDMCQPNNPYNIKFYTSNWYKSGWN